MFSLSERSARRAARPLRLLPTLALLLPCLALPARARQAPVAAVAESCRPAVVHVQVRFASGSSHSGDSVRVERSSSGVVISSEGLVLTNAHLVAEIEDGAGAEEPSTVEFWLRVVTQDGGSFPARLVGRDERTDLALLQLELPAGVSLPAAPLGSTEPPAPGARLVTLAFPDGEHTYSFQGAAAHSGGEVQLRDDRLASSDVLITDTRSHRMLDGGPLFDAEGELVGLYNSSHVQQAVQKRDDEDDDDKPDEPVVEYVVIVSTHAIRSSFADRVDGLRPTLPPPAGTEPELAIDAIAAIAPSVLSVWTVVDEPHPSVPSGSDPHGQRLDKHLGSGVVLDPGGLVVTSSDLFHGKTEGKFSVRTATGETYPAELIEKRAAKQLALVKVDLPEGVRLQAAEIGDSAAAKCGEFTAVVGRPNGPVTTLSVGVLGNLTRGQGYFQVASWLHRGHWGGAVVDRDGRLLGVVVEKALGEDEVSEGVFFGFAAPVDRILEWFDDEWLEYASPETRAAVVPDTEVQRAQRVTPVTEVVDAIQASLVNIAVSKAEVQEESSVFDPFAEESSGEPEYELLGQGSGVIIDASGLTLTNWHVVDAAVDGRGEELEGYKVEVTLPDGRAFLARVLSTSRDDDLALIQLAIGDGDELHPVAMADSDELVLGQPVVAIGNALGFSDSVSAGTISCKSIDVMIQGRLREYEGMLMTDAAINFGNSGGALLDLQGRLVGINSAGRVGAGMAIPVNRAREVFRGKLLSAQKLRSVYLGLRAVDIDGRVLARDIDPDGPAQRAGVQEDDVLARLGGELVANATTWAQLRLRGTAGTPVPLVVEREGVELELELLPLGYETWRIQRQSGIEVSEVGYDADPELVREASVALHRAYSGLPEAVPSSTMTGVLRVVRAHSVEPRMDLDILPGDLLLGVTRIVHDSTPPSRELIKLDSLERLTATFGPLATKDGTRVECWVLRDGEVKRVNVTVRRPRES